MKSIAIIPARGGSKGILRKNVRMFAGAPLVSHTIRAALLSGVFSAVVVSTEDAEIAEIARLEGAAVVLRPGNLASDAALTEPVMEHALAQAETGEPAHFDAVWLLQPTSPLRTASDIRHAAALLGGADVDAVVSMVSDHSFLWGPATDDPDSVLVVPTYDLACRPRRQDLAPRWRENGATYGVMRALWDATGLRAAGRIARSEMPANRSIEIDDEADWILAEAAFNSMTPAERQ